MCEIVGVLGNHKAALYRPRRQQVQNHRFFRCAYLAVGVGYVCALTYGQLVGDPDGHVSSNQVLGLLLAYLAVAAACWSMAVSMMPFLESLLLDYSSIMSAAGLTMYALYYNYGHNLDIMRGVSYAERIVFYVSVGSQGHGGGH